TVMVVSLVGGGVAGAASMALAAPLLSVDPYLWLQRTLDEAPPARIVAATAGVVVSLLIAALVAVLLSPLPWGIGVIASIGLGIALVYVGMSAASRRGDALLAVFGRSAPPAIEGPPALDGLPVVVDTSVLIDGRIVDVAAAGFIPGRLLLPHVVLEELQQVADSGDATRRAKGRRGLNVVSELQERGDVVCEVVDERFPGTPAVDAQLIKLARLRAGLLMTQDYNLTRLAQIEGVRVLNLNNLANAVKPVMASGETMSVTVVKEGKEPGQGVAYLEDGTMVVVENGRAHLEESVEVTVTSVLQTAAGRMIFAALAAEARPARPARQPRARVVSR
ncbi:MAG TPA: TRAM domain-containing protein, partial [Dehalococcoidia bacterium]|nr:TRAM domain-containing protein [Dehalococcoidia bacterium]